MEIVWHGEFDRLFSQYFPHQWVLVPTFYAPTDRMWQVFKDSAKVRFSCAVSRIIDLLSVFLFVCLPFCFITFTCLTIFLLVNVSVCSMSSILDVITYSIIFFFITDEFLHICSKWYFDNKRISLSK